MMRVALLICYTAVVIGAMRSMIQTDVEKLDEYHRKSADDIATERVAALVVAIVAVLTFYMLWNFS